MAHQRLWFLQCCFIIICLGGFSWWDLETLKMSWLESKTVLFFSFLIFQEFLLVCAMRLAFLRYRIAVHISPSGEPGMLLFSSSLIMLFSKTCNSLCEIESRISSGDQGCSISAIRAISGSPSPVPMFSLLIIIIQVKQIPVPVNVWTSSCSISAFRFLHHLFPRSGVSRFALALALPIIRNKSNHFNMLMLQNQQVIQRLSHCHSFVHNVVFLCLENHVLWSTSTQLFCLLRFWVYTIEIAKVKFRLSFKFFCRSTRCLFFPTLAF